VNVRREFPHHELLLEIDAEPVGRPRERHPAFYGSYDWHSCVEMHWVLVRLLRAVPELVPADEIRAVLDDHLTADALATEARWFADPNRRTAERPYGWGWALTLAAELGALGDEGAGRWAGNLAPLAGVLVGRYLEWLPLVTYPVRSGMHDNGAFGLSLALPYARRAAGRGDTRLLAAIHAWPATNAPLVRTRNFAKSRRAMKLSSGQSIAKSRRHRGCACIGRSSGGSVTSSGSRVGS